MADPIELLHGPYTPPPLRKGDRAVCLAWDADVVVTEWSSGRLSWPRCRRPGTRGAGSGLLVDAELARAVRCESVAAVCHWWGVARDTAWAWRRALGVPRFNEGSRRLQLANACKGGAATRGRPKARRVCADPWSAGQAASSSARTAARQPDQPPRIRP
jgi:hypothetical protein